MTNFWILSSEENQNPASATNKDQDNEKESSDTAAKDYLYSNPLLKSERETKQIVSTRPPRRAYHHRGRLRDDEGPKEIHGRGFRARRGRGNRNRPGRSRGRGAAGKKCVFLTFLISLDRSDWNGHQQNYHRFYWTCSRYTQFHHLWQIDVINTGGDHCRRFQQDQGSIVRRV